MVRSEAGRYFKAAWPFVKKGNFGHRKIGPMTFEKIKWPGQNKEFPEFNPKHQGINPKELKRYTMVQPTGYEDPVSGSYVHVPEMVPELVVPDLTGCELKPYVSFRTDVEIEKRMRSYEKSLRAKGTESASEEVAEAWPPTPMNAKTLFDIFYAEKVEKAIHKKQKEAGSAKTMQTGSVGVVPASNANENPNVFEVARKCLLRIADLRNGIIKTHEFLSAGLETERAEHDLDQFKLRLEKFSKEIADGYE
uniref:39S ribosomal protein L41, mitochondrial n=1 Tax=Ditylenchus dipsaci TaxID=166011 RepID=A0A915EAZ1_9BILA